MNKTVIAAALLCVFTVSSFAQASAPAPAASKAEWRKTHPRRAEVNHRLANQNRRIDQEVKEGEMSKGKAAKLHKEDRQIRQEERDMASQDHGHITKQEQRTLNQQENQVNKQIGQ